MIETSLQLLWFLVGCFDLSFCMLAALNVGKCWLRIISMQKLSMTAKGILSALRYSSCANELHLVSSARSLNSIPLCFGDSFMNHHLYADEGERQTKTPQLSVSFAGERRNISKASASKLNNFLEILNKPKKIRKTAILYSRKKVEKSERRQQQQQKKTAEDIHVAR